MLKFRGHQYRALKRLALTPEQKKPKRQYQLNQSQRASHIPTLEEVIDYHWLDYVADYDGELSEEELRDTIEQQYDEAVTRVNWELHGQDVYRGIKLPDGVDPRTHEGLGVFWSLSRDGVDNAVPENPSVAYHARCDSDYVDDGGTVWANCAPFQGPDEEEVRFHKYAPIWGYGFWYPDGDYVELDDWRTT